MSDDEQLEEIVEALDKKMSGDPDVNQALVAAFSNDFFCKSIQFEDFGLVVNFVYKDEETENVAMQRTVAITLSEDNYKILFCEFQDRIEWLVNDALPKLRNA